MTDINTISLRAFKAYKSRAHLSEYYIVTLRESEGFRLISTLHAVCMLLCAVL